MARKTFISYKYSEARNLRDRILLSLGNDAIYYQGETSESPNMNDLKTATIKYYLSDMIFNTSVTIVIISPNMTMSKWIDWEIAYSMREQTRNDRTSRCNGVVGVIQKFNGGYDWLIYDVPKFDGCKAIDYRKEYLYPIINKNHENSVPPRYHCPVCKTFNHLYGSYISYIREEAFLSDPDKYIENAYEKSQIKDQYSHVRSL